MRVDSVRVHFLIETSFLVTGNGELFFPTYRNKSMTEYLQLNVEIQGRIKASSSCPNGLSKLKLVTKTKRDKFSESLLNKDLKIISLQENFSDYAHSRINQGKPIIAVFSRYSGGQFPLFMQANMVYLR